MQLAEKTILALGASTVQAARAEYLKQQAAYERLKQEYEVVLEPEFYIEVPQTLMSLMAAGSWVYDYMQIPFVGDLIKAGKLPQRKVVAGIIDTGGKSKSKFLANTGYREDLSASFVATEPDLNDNNRHFSMVASTKFGRDESPFGVCWLPGQKEIWWEWFGAKGLNSQGSGSLADLAKAGYHCIEIKRKYFKDVPMVVNASFGGSMGSSTFDAMLEEMEKEGIFFIAAAGNNGGAVNYPGNHKRAFAYSAIDQQGNKASFSCFGPQIFGAAPGVNVPVASNTETGRGFADGTSFSSPIGAGLTMILLAYYPEIKTPADLRAFVAEGNFDDYGQIGKDNIYGFGVPRAKNLLDNAPKDTPNDPEDEPETPKPTPTLPDARVYNVPVENELGVWWKPQEQGKFNHIRLHFTVDFTSKLYAQDAIDAITQKTIQFCTNRAFVLLKGDDMSRALYWIRHFYEMILKKEGFDVQVTLLHGRDEGGRTLQLPVDRERTAVRVRDAKQVRMIMIKNQVMAERDVVEQVQEWKYGK